MTLSWDSPSGLQSHLRSRHRRRSRSPAHAATAGQRAYPSSHVRSAWSSAARSLLEREREREGDSEERRGRRRSTATATSSLGPAGRDRLVPSGAPGALEGPGAMDLAAVIVAAEESDVTEVQALGEQLRRMIIALTR